jgi:hypothetical protein
MEYCSLAPQAVLHQFWPEMLMDDQNDSGVLDVAVLMPRLVR